MYAEQWPHLAKVTNNLDNTLLAYVGAHLENYSIEVQIDYADYTAFIIEYSDWSDRIAAASHAQEFDW